MNVSHLEVWLQLNPMQPGLILVMRTMTMGLVTRLQD